MGIEKRREYSRTLFITIYSTRTSSSCSVQIFWLSWTISVLKHIWVFHAYITGFKFKTISEKEYKGRNKKSVYVITKPISWQKGILPPAPSWLITLNIHRWYKLVIRWSIRAYSINDQLWHSFHFETPTVTLISTQHWLEIMNLKYENVLAN